MKNIFAMWASMLSVVAAALLFTACGDNDDPKPTLKPEVEVFTFTSGTYSKVLAVETEHLKSFDADVAYAGSETGWVTPQVVEGGVKVSVQPNTSSAPRSAKLVLSAAGMQDVEVEIAQKAKFTSELIGSYLPKANPSAYDYGFYVSAEWTSEEATPKLPMGGDAVLEWGLVEMMLSMLVGPYYTGGLAGLELMDDGRIGVKYHAVSLPGGIGDIFVPTIGEETLSFPDPVAFPVVPVDVMGYYTQGGKIYLTVDKQFIAKMDPGTLDQPIVKMIDGLIAKYNLAFVSNEQFFALPLKYKVEGDMLTLYVDREMMLPFKQVLVDLIGNMVPDEGIALGEDMSFAKADILKFVTDMFDNSTKLELGIKLTKLAE